jgi:hypothetical protein
MLIPFLAPYLVWLDIALVFYPLAIFLMILCIFNLPADLLESEPRYPGDQKPGSPTATVFFSMLLYAIILYHFGFDVSSWARWVPALVGYLILGVIWSTGKWWFFCGRVRNHLSKFIDKFNSWAGDEKKENYLRRLTRAISDEGDIRKYKSLPYVRDDQEPWPREKIIDTCIPLVTKHKGIVLTWLFCWPISILKWALADMLHDLYNAVFNAIKGFFQKIAAKRFNGI